MALTGLDIYKLLPRTNCGDCGSPTCLAFAMKLARQNRCLSMDALMSAMKQRLSWEAPLTPPIRLVTIGTGDAKIKVGNETVLFRHEETFYHETGLAIRLRENDPEAEKRLEAINNLQFVRVGEDIFVNLLALEEESGDPEKSGFCRRLRIANPSGPRS